MGWLSRLRPRKPKAPDERFGFAIVGLGQIAGKIVEALRDSPHARVSAAVSRSPERAETFARRHGLDHAYTYEQWDEIASNRSIDAMYMALPVAHHRSFAERSFLAGKHVLCEKPMAASPADARAMIDGSLAARRLLMLAYRLDYDPMHDELKRLLATDVFGTIQNVRSGFGFVAKPGWRLDPALAGGGSIFDVGVYPIHALHEFFGTTTLTRAAIVEDPNTRMEMEAQWSGTLANGATFEASSSYLRDIPDTLEIRGDRGRVTLTDAYNYKRTALDATWTDAGGKAQRLRTTDAKRASSLFRLECEHLAQCVREGTPLKSSGESGLRDQETIAAIEAFATRTPRR